MLKKLNKDTFGLRLRKSFLFRAQAVFFGRLTIGCLYATLFILSLANESLGFPHTIFDGCLIVFALFNANLSYRLKNHPSLGRWIHFLTLIADLLINLIFTRQSGLLFSPLMALHPLFTAMFLLLFHNALLIGIPLLTIPLHTILTLLVESSTNIFSMLYALLLYCLLDALIIFFIHLAQSQEQRLLKSLVAIEKKLKHLALAHERSRIARDFHDGIGAQLTSIVLQCDYVALLAKEKNLLSELSEIRESAVLSMEDMRRSIALLHDDFDIAEQVTRLCENMSGRHHLKVEMRGIYVLNGLNIEQQIACCRIVQESLTNILKHAHATLVVVSAERNEHSVALTVRDNGVGFSEEKSERHHFGLGNMHDRARHIGGHLVIRSQAHRGTEVVLSIAHGGTF